jgi:hypothetical protein
VRLLIDANLSPKVAAALRKAGLESVHVGLGLVHLGGISGGVCREGGSELAAYSGVFQQLRAFALSPAESVRLLRGLGGA